MQVSATRNRHSEFLDTLQVASSSSAMTPVQTHRDLPSELEESRASTRYVFVKPGDTLWSIAQRYRVRLEQLRTLNQLTDNRIEIGQALWLPDNRSMSGVSIDKSASAQ
jgi:LysM repeat protein